MRTTADPITVILSGFATGAEIRGVDLSRPIDETIFRAIEDAFNEHGVFFSRPKPRAGTATRLHVVKPEFQYHHKWQAGDVLMWDNCTAQHMSR